MKLFKSLSTILAVALLTGIIGTVPAYAKDMTIKDMDPANESYANVQWVIGQGYMSLTLGRFLPSKYVKRSEFAAIITKLTGNGTALQNPKTPTFQDVTAKNQFYRQIETAKSYMTSFKQKNAKLFKPDGYLTREDAMYSIVKIFGYDLDESMGSNENSDVSLDDLIEDADSISTTLVKYLSVGISNELMDCRTSGDKLYFDPKKNITRLDLANLIHNANQKKDYTTEETSEEDSSSTGSSGSNTGSSGSSTQGGGSQSQDTQAEPQDQPNAGA